LILLDLLKNIFYFLVYDFLVILIICLIISIAD